VILKVTNKLLTIWKQVKKKQKWAVKMLQDLLQVPKLAPQQPQ
jgi:hypothetical protein